MGQHFITFEPVKVGNETAYVQDNGVEMFRYNHLQVALMLTPEEEEHAATLCLQARIRGGWRGDILHPEPYNVTEANDDAVPRILPEQGQGLLQDFSFLD